jgi:hypothetical protein
VKYVREFIYSNVVRLDVALGCNRRCYSFATNRNRACYVRSNVIGHLICSHIIIPIFQCLLSFALFLILIPLLIPAKPLGAPIFGLRWWILRFVRLPLNFSTLTQVCTFIRLRSLFSLVPLLAKSVGIHQSVISCMFLTSDLFFRRISVSLSRLPPSDDGEWWELIDESRSLPYYYHTKTGDTVWERPGGFVIPLKVIQVRSKPPPRRVFCGKPGLPV